MRKYQPIWIELKKSHSASIKAPINMHRRIIQGVRKEKWRDRGWILLMSEQGKKYKLKDTSSNSGASNFLPGTITFYLVPELILSTSLF